MTDILITEKSADYELLDSGEGEKLERYGSVLLSRPDPQAIWAKTLTELEWKEADAIFKRTGTSGKWQTKKEIGNWQMKLEDLIFSLELLPSKHLGVFPEQSEQWKWLAEKIKNSGRSISVLNLFAYTGGASLTCAKAGATVCHVDSSQFAVDLAHKNLDLSGMSDKPVRFIVDDVRKFVEREIKRGNKYDVILLDPPVYGKGTSDKVWKIEEDFLPLLSRVKEVLSEDPVAVILNGYASIYSPITYQRMLNNITSGHVGDLSSGELAIRESSSGELLPCGIFARWSK